MEAYEEGPIVLPLESGVVRHIKLAGAQRTPASIGIAIGVLMFITFMYGQPKAIYLLLIVVGWHGFWMWAYHRDPQYWEVLWRQWIEYRLPAWVDAWPSVWAPEVKIEPTVPYRGVAGTYGG